MGLEHPLLFHWVDVPACLKNFPPANKLGPKSTPSGVRVLQSLSLSKSLSLSWHVATDITTYEKYCGTRQSLSLRSHVECQHQKLDYKKPGCFGISQMPLAAVGRLGSVRTARWRGASPGRGHAREKGFQVLVVLLPGMPLGRWWFSVSVG